MLQQRIARNEDFHEVWWIYSDHDASWAGLRIAHFTTTGNGHGLFSILGETPERTGIRIFHDVAKREGWRKIEQIPIPAV